MRTIIGILSISLLLTTGTFANAQNGRHAQTTKGRICGDPTVHCRTSVEFDAWDLPFEVPKNGVIWESEAVYIVILQSVKSNDNCDNFVAETARLEAQGQFPHNKVFTNRCEGGGSIYLSNIAADTLMMAVFAGRTRADANAMLAKVKALGTYPGANIRRIKTGFNGT
jgi:hypothetical protein